MDRSALAYRQELQKHGMELVEGAVVKTVRGISSTEYLITGELNNVLEAVKSVFTAYPSVGYGTYIKYGNQLADGNYGIQMGRSNSCE